MVELCNLGPLPGDEWGFTGVCVLVVGEAGPSRGLGKAGPSQGSGPALQWLRMWLQPPPLPSSAPLLPAFVTLLGMGQAVCNCAAACSASERIVAGTG